MHEATSEAELLIEQLWEQLDDIDSVKLLLEDALELIKQDIKQLEEITQ